MADATPEGAVLFQRQVHTTLKKLSESRLLVEATLRDTEHQMGLYLLIDVPRQEIVGAWGEMGQAPFEICRGAMVNLPKLKGLAIGRGIARQIAHALGGVAGCVHLVEVATSAVRVAAPYAMAMALGQRPEPLDQLRQRMRDEDIIALGMPFLNNTCLVYRED